MLDSPLIVATVEGMGVEIAGTVHALSRIAPLAVNEIERFSPDCVCVELKAPGQRTRSYEILEARSRFPGKIVAIDRPIETTICRYMSDTPPLQFFIESMIRYFYIPPNMLSIVAFNRLPQLYKTITGGRFITFGWAWNDRKVFIFERDEYMAAKVAEMIRADRDERRKRRYAILVGRRHVAGIAAVLEAYRYTGCIGSYYAGGKTYDVFSLASLEEPYTGDYATSSGRFMKNRIIEGFLHAFFLPAYMFLLVIAMAFIAVAIVLMILEKP
jgi:hypothetical protein